MTTAIGIPLGALLGAAASDARVQPDRRGIPEAQVERLRDVLALYQAPNSFTPGQLVTPRKGRSLRGAGDPHIVLEVIAPIVPSFRSDACCSEKRFDMRIAWLAKGGEVLTNWVESFELEPWQPTMQDTATSTSTASAPA